MTTQGITFLKRKKVKFEVIKYDHLAKGAEFAAKAVSFPLDQTIKTLVVALEDKRFVLVLMPGNRQLSYKKIAAVCGAKRAAMADATTAQRLTGYQIGGISPFGTKKKLPTFMELRLQKYSDVMINAGQRGVMVKMCPKDIVNHLNAEWVDLVQD